MRIALIGFGKVGYHLYQVLKTKDFELVGIYNRSNIEKKTISNIPVVHKLSEIADAELYLLAVIDDAIYELSGELSKYIPKDAIVAHTSGIYGPEILDDSIQHPGNFYPLNTFSKESDINWANTPIFILGSPFVKSKLKTVAKNISNQYYEINQEQKSQLHLAAVFANNFTNALFQVAFEILADQDLSLEPLWPLIRQTIQKLASGDQPKTHQTGPAVRRDMKTIQKHLTLLENSKIEQQIYQILSELIIQQSNTK